MNGEIEWEGLPIICEIIGIEDPAELIDDLMTIRQHVRRKHG